MIRDVGVQGPVTYRGSRFVAHNQGFARGFECEAGPLYTRSTWMPPQHTPVTIPEGAAASAAASSPLVPTNAFPSDPIGTAGEPADDSESRRCVARFSSVCQACNRAIRPGDRLLRQLDKWCHEGCRLLHIYQKPASPRGEMWLPPSCSQCDLYLHPGDPIYVFEGKVRHVDCHAAFLRHPSMQPPTP